MDNNQKVNVAIIGLGFGAEFIPIYQSHPYANMYAICRRDESEMAKIGNVRAMTCEMLGLFCKKLESLQFPLTF